MAKAQIIDMKKHGEAGSTLEFGFYLWREDATSPWQLARLLEDGWLELFEEDPRGGSNTFTWYGEILGTVPLNWEKLAVTMIND